MSYRLKSLSIFFPFYNDGGTVEKAISDAYFYGHKVAKKLEVIALHGGPSRDNTWTEILRLKKRYPSLKILDRRHNTQGYGVIKHGLRAATQDWVFYTDGDLQYRVQDLPSLVRKTRRRDVSVVNGYKLLRRDLWIREMLGSVYQNIARWAFDLPIQDVDCDFRLIQTKLLQHIRLTSSHASILPELIKKLEWAGAKFAEVPVIHLPRRYGQSNYKPLGLLKEKIVGDIVLWRKLYTQLKKALASFK
jgi:glycosyltransferase involved in cell wall biosynthesis